jgi:hypothetical protein
MSESNEEWEEVDNEPKPEPKKTKAKAKPKAKAKKPAPEPEPEPVIVDVPSKKKREGVKMSEKQKADLTKHMTKIGKDMTVSERKSHRMKMMSRMRKGETVGKAHKALSS